MLRIVAFRKAILAGAVGALAWEAAVRVLRLLGLPMFEAGGMPLIKRLTLVVSNGRIEKVLYPVFPPDKNAEEVLAYLRTRTNA